MIGKGTKQGNISDNKIENGAIGHEAAVRSNAQV